MLRKALFASAMALCALTGGAALAASFNNDGSIDGACGSLKLSRDAGALKFMNGSGDAFEFHISCSHAPEKSWFCGMYMEGKKIVVDAAAKKAAFQASIPAMGKDPAAKFELSQAETADGAARVQARFECEGDAAKIYHAVLKAHIRADFAQEGRSISVDGSPISMENDTTTEPRSKLLYSGKPKEILYKMAQAGTMRISPVETANVSVSQLYDTQRKSYYLELKFELESNAATLDVDLGAAKNDAQENVFEGVDFNPNKFVIPNYRLCRNLVQNPSFEQGFDYWTFFSLGKLMDNKLGEHFSIDDTTAFDGKRSLKIKGQAGENPAPPSTFAIPLQPGAAYTFSFYAKTDKPGVAVVSVSGDTDVFGSFIKGASFKPSSDWKRYVCSFTPVNMAVTMFLSVNSPKEDCVVWIDAVQLEKSKEATEFTQNPVGVKLETSRRDNFFQPGEKTEAALRVRTVKPNEKGSAEIAVKDFFDVVERKESVRFETGTDGETSLALPWADQLPSGLHIFDIALKLDSGFADRRFGRIVKMKFMANDFKLKNMFCAGAGDGRVDNWARRMELWEKTGLGSAIHFNPPTHEYLKLMAERKILDFSSIFEKGALESRFNLASKPASDSKLKWISELSEEDFKIAEEDAFNRAKEYPEIRYWKLINEPQCTITDEEMAITVKLVAAARKGILRANPDAKIISPDPANMAPNSGIKYLDRYFEAGGAKLTDIVGIHPYRQSPEDPDLDADTKTMIDVVDKHFGKGMDIWFTEGMYFMDYNIPAFMLDAFNSASGGDHIRLRSFSYDLGVGERMCAANAARYWLTCLKHSDRVKLSVDWSVLATRDYCGIDMIPQALAFSSATLAKLLGESKFLSDVDFGENIRCYVFDDGKGRPVAALWNYDPSVAKGSVPPSKLRLNAIPKNVEFVDLMGKTFARPQNETLEISAVPVFIVGEAGKTKELIDALSKSQVLGANVKLVNFLAKFDSATQVKLSVANLLSKPVEGRLKLTQDGTAVYEGQVSIKGKSAFEKTASVPESSDSLKTATFAMEFAPASGSEPEKASVNFEYFACAKAEEPFKIDGDMAKWEKRPSLKLDRFAEWKPGPAEVAKGIVAKPWGGEKDLSGRMWTAWDQSFLYIAFDIKDDKIVVAESVEKAWQADSVQLYFDSWGDARAKSLKGYDHNDQTYDVWFDKGLSKVEVFRRVVPEWQLAFTKMGIVKEAKAAIRKTQDGYFLELAFPKKDLAPIRFEKGVSFGFAALVNDNDGEFRARGLTTTPAGTEPHQNPKLYPIIILE